MYQMKEINVGLSILPGQSQVSFETNLIKGHLDGMIIESDSKVEILIISSLGYVIFQEKDYFGTYYYAPRTQISSTDASMNDRLSFDKFNLNESIIITVIGPDKSIINFTIRVE